MAGDTTDDEDREDSGLTWLYSSPSAATSARERAAAYPPPDAPDDKPMPPEPSRRPKRTPPPQSVVQTPSQSPVQAAPRPVVEAAPQPFVRPAPSPTPRPKASRDVPGVTLSDSGYPSAPSARQTGGEQRQTAALTPDGATRPKHLFPRRVRLAITITVAVLLSYIAALIVIPLAAWSGVERVDSEPGASHIADTPGTAILLVGSDSRDAMTEEEREELGVGNAYGKRTDTMMIYFIPKSGPAVLLSLPRDTYIDIPGVGYDKLNAAHAYGGAPLLVETVEVRTGIRIDGYLEVGMAEFANLIDYVGGLDVCIDYDVADPDSNLYLNAGCHHLDGAQGLAYVRMRYADPRGDLGRVERQREAVSQVMDKVAVKSNVLLPWRWYSTTHALVDLITAGEDTSILDMFSAGLGALDFVSGNGLQLTVPISNPGADTEVGSAVIWDDDAADELFALLRSGDTTGVERFVK